MNNIYKETYLDIILQTWNRFEINDLINATAIITNNFLDPWISAKGPGQPTGRKILQKMNNEAYKTYGSQLKNTSSLSDGLDDHSFNINSILNYWKIRSSSGDSFSSEMYNSLLSHTGFKPKPVLASEVGKLAFGIWKALNSREVKKQQNLEDFNNNNYNLTEGQKVQNIDLVVKDIKSEVQHRAFGGGYYERPRELICKNEENGFTYKVKLSAKTSRKLFDFIQSIKDTAYEEKFKALPEFEKIYKINVSGKISKINKEYKSLNLNYVTINSPTDIEINNLTDLFYDKKAQFKQEEKFKLQNEKKFNEALAFIKWIPQILKNDPTIKTNEQFIKILNSSLARVNQPKAFSMLTEQDKLIIQEVQDLIKDI